MSPKIFTRNDIGVRKYDEYVSIESGRGCLGQLQSTCRSKKTDVCPSKGGETPRGITIYNGPTANNKSKDRKGNKMYSSCKEKTKSIAGSVEKNLESYLVPNLDFGDPGTMGSTYRPKSKIKNVYYGSLDSNFVDLKSGSVNISD
jgi:hypothetical protein